MPESISKQHVRQLAVVKQGLHQRPPQADSATLQNIIRTINLLQLDSISVVARSHYLVMLSRAGVYDPADLDALLDNGHLFEQWVHVASIVPIEDYPYVHARTLNRRETKNYVERRLHRLGDEAQATLDHVRAELKARGPLSSKEFESPRKGESGWWNWKPAKVVLEYLFDIGEIMVSHRVNFHRYYDFTENVLNGHNFTLDKTIDDHDRWATLQGLRAQGIATRNAIADYYRIAKQSAQKVLDDLIAEGEVEAVEVEGYKDMAYLHREDRALLEEVIAGGHPAKLTTFLSPFDNLIWERQRLERLFDFYYRIEVYTPKAKRQYGYYTMPILHNGVLVGRIDPKIERKDKRFLMHALHLEPDAVVDDSLIDGLIAAIREFMVFHDCEHFTLGTCTDAQLKKALVKGM